MKKTFCFLNCSGKKALLLLALTLVLAVLVVDVTLAILMTRTGEIENVFSPSVLRISLQMHEGEELEHKHEDITNIGDVPVYLRVYTVANWVSKEEEHTILSETPTATMVKNEDGSYGDADFYVEFKDQNAWFQSDVDHFYYYKKPLEAGEGVAMVTEVLQLREREGYELHVELISTAIQANPKEAVEEAWTSVHVDENGNLAEGSKAG